MMELVYDASALLVVMFDEAGAERVLECLAQPGGAVSTVNLAEVGAKLAERGLEPDEIARELDTFGLDVVPFDAAQAVASAALRPTTRALGLSLGDRCCLALAQVRQARVVTADSAWQSLGGFDILVVR